MEGIARELVSKVQNLRKTSGFDIVDRIEMTYKTDSIEVKNAINAYKDYISKEILALKLDESDKSTEELKINDYTLYVTIKKVDSK